MSYFQIFLVSQYFIWLFFLRPPQVEKVGCLVQGWGFTLGLQEWYK